MRTYRPVSPVSAFSLIEILIVVSIISILSGIAVANYLTAQTRAKVARVKSDMRTVLTALEAYQGDNNGYPPEGYPNGAPGIGRTDDGQLQQIDPILDSSLSLIRLTTPIAYLTMLDSVNDPFLTNARLTDAASVAGRNVHSFFYVDYRHFAQLRFTAVEDRAAVFSAWGLASVGPDRTNDGSLFIPWLFARNGESALPAIAKRIYDPTNGTVSQGDIVRFGGEVGASVMDLTGN